ncbi:MAG: DUF3576 domain-containing protein [Alphaproteobacteria bacterium]
MSNRIYFLFFVILLLQACSSGSSVKAPIDSEDRRKLGFGSLGGDNFLVFGAGAKRGKEAHPMVNKYLWRASLDTLSFMPLSSADAMGGVIVTDWATSPKNFSEKTKITVFITGADLHSDNLKVLVYKKMKTGNRWKNMEGSEDTALKLEDIILTKARDLYSYSTN